MPTVSQEMTPEERQKRLLHGLKACGDETVVVNVSHLAHALGMDEAEKLATNLREMDGLLPSRYSRTAKFVRQGLCEVDRLAVIEAIENKQGGISTISGPKSLMRKT